MFWFDYTYILVLIGAIIAMMASANVNRSFNKYSQVANRRGYTGADAARQILSSAGIYDVRIERVSGHLTDHYSPKEKVLRLSDSVYGSSSVAAIGVAAHECGHAVQYNVGYAPIHIRSLVIPLAQIGSQLSWPMIFLGLVLGYYGLIQAGIVLFSMVVIFQLVTLPVEFDASSRALRILESSSMLEGDELTGAKRVLTAAALTYVAALLSSILQLLRLVLLSGRRRR